MFFTCSTNGMCHIVYFADSLFHEVDYNVFEFITRNKFITANC